MSEAYYDSMTKISHGKEIPQIFSPQASIGQVLLYNFFKSPDRILQVSADDGIELTCSQMTEMMKNIAKHLKKMNVPVGETAGFIARNTTFAAPAIFACCLYGVPLNPLDVTFSVDQIVQVFKETKPAIIFADHTVVQKLILALALMRSNAEVVVITEKIDGFMHISEMTAPLENEIRLSLNLEDSNTLCAAILCTSGTTGKPKLARISHAQLLLPFTSNQFNEKTFSLNFSSLYWLTGFSNVIFQAVNLHKRLITAESFSPNLCFDLIEKYQLKHVFLLPPHLKRLVESSRFKTADLTSIDIFTTGGLFVSEHLVRKLRDRLECKKVCVAYGMTEVGGIIAETDPFSEISQSVGKPAVNAQIKILIDDGSIGTVHEIGEILVKKPVPFLDYFGNHHNRLVDSEGWLHTGDMGFIDKNGEINIAGQRTFLIKNFYHEFYPSELEEIIETIEGVKQCCVVGVPDIVEIEVPSALIVRQKGGVLINEDDIRTATSHLPPHKRIRDVFFVDNLPSSTSGKIQRRIAKDIAEEMKIFSLRTLNHDL